ncbi:MAG: FAD-dependent oxidoreductase [Chloroflexota bacterium]
MEQKHDVIIIGAGPAGLTAGLYTARARLNTLILERELMGGELMNRELIENYPGYPEGVMGPELGSNMLNQAMNVGASIEMAEVTGLEVSGAEKVVQTTGGTYRSRGLILAGGSHSRKLGVPGEADFEYRGVFACATCDGPQFADKVVAVAGGGNSGVTEALILARIASRVILLEMLPELTATEILRERVRENDKIEVRCGVKVAAITGQDHVSGIDVVDVKSGNKESVAADGVLVHVGIDANTAYVKDSVPLNERGQVIVDENMATGVPGVYAAGDIRANSPWQISTAVGDGAHAAMSLEKYLNSLK